MMNKYESIFIVDPDIGEENIQALVEKFRPYLRHPHSWRVSMNGERGSLPI